MEAVQSYHKALPLEDFLDQLAPYHWPQGNRAGYCYRFLLLLFDIMCTVEVVIVVEEYRIPKNFHKMPCNSISRKSFTKRGSKAWLDDIIRASAHVQANISGKTLSQHCKICEIHESILSQKCLGIRYMPPLQYAYTVEVVIVVKEYMPLLQYVCC